MILARVAIAACVHLVLAACASAENDDLAAVAENPSTTAVEVESVDATETTDSATELDADEPDPAAATTTAPPDSHGLANVTFDRFTAIVNSNPQVQTLVGTASLRSVWNDLGAQRYDELAIAVLAFGLADAQNALASSYVSSDAQPFSLEQYAVASWNLGLDNNDFLRAVSGSQDAGPLTRSYIGAVEGHAARTTAWWDEIG